MYRFDKIETLKYGSTGFSMCNTGIIKCIFLFNTGIPNLFRSSTSNKHICLHCCTYIS